MHDGTAGPSTAAAVGPFRLEPFRGLVLAPRRVGDPASARAFARPYRDVADRLRRWEKQGHVTRDAAPAVYLHEYSADGITIRGLVGALDVSRRSLDPTGQVVLPHEGVHEAQAGELAQRMAEMELNPAPILLVHRGPARVRALVHQVMESAPDRQFVDRAERHNRLWAIRPGPVLDELATALASSRPLVADGHHRYAAYLRLQEQRPGTSADRGLAMLVDQDDTPLFLGAIHRTLGQTDLADLRRVVAEVPEQAAFVETTEPLAMAALGPSTLAVTDGRAWARLELALRPGQAAVQVLHEQLLPRLPGRRRGVAYHHSVDDALGAVTQRRRTAVLMPAPDFDLVDAIVSAAALLPEKATSFQPKPSIGVIMRSLLDG